jgi:hypothetical protein
MMFKILVIQAANNLSDERTEFLINDRLSFMRFLGLGLSDRVPDARTIWLFRERLTKAGAIKALFDRFDAALRASGYIAMSGQIVDASLISAPKQRNTEDEKRAIKEGRIPDETPAKGSRRPLDGQVQQGEGAGGRNEAAGRHRYPDLRLSKSYLDRQRVRLHPQVGGDRCGRLRGRPSPRRSARQDQHVAPGLGGHRLPVESQRGVHGKERLRQPHPSQEGEGQAYT